MAISCIHVGNFKGISADCSIEIKPITLFIGANSSGKSSCIHAITCLSQTVKVTNDTRPLILDDEFANIHLGRFIEVIHSKSYQDLITLGISIENAQYAEIGEIGEKIKVTRKQDKGSAIFSFKCSKRTQDIHIESSQYKIGSHEYQSKYQKKRKGGNHDIHHIQSGAKCSFGFEGAFFIDRQALFRTNREKNDHFFPLFGLQNALKSELSNTFYLGPFRQAPLRRYATRGSSPIEVGPMGESTITLLANEAVQSRTRSHIKQIASWLNVLGLAKSLEVSRIARSDLFDITMTLEDGATFPIADLGYGLSQVLPVLTQCSFAPKHSTLLFEQPELHLHTVAARKLATVFARTAAEKKCNIILETHSPELFKEFLSELRAGKIGKNDFVAYKVFRDDQHSVVKKIEIDTENDFDVYDNWEKGISIG